VSEPTELERRLAAKVTQQAKAERAFSVTGAGIAFNDCTFRPATCLHAFKRLGEIGSAVLDECEDCGLGVGVAR